MSGLRRVVDVEQGVALAEMWQAGDRYAQALDATYLDGEGRARSLALGRYRVYLDRLLAAIAESQHDEHGLLWPAAVAPCQVHLLTLGKATPEVIAAAEQVYAGLAQAGVNVLYDDRDERAGVKFNDADLIGAPLRVAVGDRGLRLARSRSSGGIRRRCVGAARRADRLCVSSIGSVTPQPKVS